MIRVLTKIQLSFFILWIIEFFWNKGVLWLFFSLSFILCIGLLIVFGIVFIQGNIRKYKKEAIVFSVLLAIHILLIIVILLSF